MQISNTRTNSTTTRGLSTAWLEAGSIKNDLLIFLHGFPDDSHVWDHQIKHFQNKYHIIAPFVRGASASTATRDLQRYTPYSIALDHLQLLAKVEGDPTRKVFVIGHDLGGIHAITLAHLLGQRLQGLVLINTLGIAQMRERLKNPRQLLRSWYMGAMQLPKIPEMIAGQLFSEEKTVAPLNQYRAFARTGKAYDQFVAKPLNVPTLVLWGVSDPFLIPPKEKEFSGISTDVTVRILRAGHWPQQEEHALTNLYLERHFAEHR